MDRQRSVTVEVGGKVDYAAAETVASRIRAALRNDPEEVIVALAPDAEVTSAEFLAFLVSTDSYLRERGGRLSLRATEARQVALLRLARLEPSEDGAEIATT